MKEYKRKRKAEEQSHDLRPNKIKKQINSSERLRSKRDIQKQLQDVLRIDISGSSNPNGEDLITELRWNMQYSQSVKCHEREIMGPEAMMSRTLKNLGLGKHNLYTCTCENLGLLTKDEILKRNGYK